jgi:hypothetical protein
LLKGTPIGWLIQDVAVSAQHPGEGSHGAPRQREQCCTTPMLVVMPDDCAGNSTTTSPARDGRGISRAGQGQVRRDKIIDSEELMKLLSTNAKEHIDARSFSSRLTDFLINDNDRHQGNWKWARLSSVERRWEPIARSRSRVSSRSAAC